MNVLVKYRTADVSHNQYVAIPAIYLSDMISWLKCSESAHIIKTTDNMQTPFDAPITWPSYRACFDYHLLSDIMANVR